MTRFVGVDAGGSKTSVLLAEGDRILARASGPAGAVRPGRALVSASRIAQTVRKALTEARLLEADVLVVGAAGVGRELERNELREGLRGEHLAVRLQVTGDLDIALEAAFGSGTGIVLLSGTGSVAAARGPDGTLTRQGGYGWQLGDEGGGYALGRAAVQAVGRARDGRGEPTALSDLLLARQGKSFDDLVRWCATAEPGELAALAPQVFAAASGGDPVARAIQDAAADELAALVARLVASAGGKGAIPCALGGGNLEPGRGLREPVLARLRKLTRLSVQEAPLDAAAGALAMARRVETLRVER